MKKIFFTSDWHVGHDNILEFDSRPFRDINHMHRVLVNNYNSTVPKDGICYFLGDVGLRKNNIVAKQINQLHGIKVLIVGNHDGGINAMYNSGFDVVLDGAKMTIASKVVTLSHCPLVGVWREDSKGMKGGQEGESWHGETRHGDKYSYPDFGQFHLHGHIHSPNRGKSTKKLGKQYDFGVVANNYRPVSISEIESWISLYEKN
jgi:calcineurin-like phosphoesterase family protein